MSPETAKRLHSDFPNFCYLKLEQPLMAPKVAEILEETDGGVQVLEGWGGMYLLEGIDAGICGAMPALGVADILQEVYDLAVGGNRDGAMDRFQDGAALSWPTACRTWSCCFKWRRGCSCVGGSSIAPPCGRPR